ncbi:MAG TPA: oxalate/formate MFS antiporter [Anaeromyxobacteraceae bacterium]|nr:oxalate/formate MFS antiporter [Anaeromyxobacteraceae bacterium]
MSDVKMPRRSWQLVGCILMMMAIANLQYAWTLFTVPLSETLGVKLSDVQIAFTLFILFETWLVPFEGYLIDRFGVRGVVSVGALMVGAAWIGAGMATTVGGLYLWYSVGGVGAGAVYGACMGLALKWFPDHRGLAAGLTAGAYGFGTALTVLPIQKMIASSGYHSAFIVFGIIQGLLVLAIVQFARSPEPGWKPAGWSPSLKVSASQSQVSYTPLQMVKSPVFYLMYFMMGMVAFGGLIVTAQLKPIARAFHLDTGVFLWGMSALSLALILDRILNGLTRPFWGWVSDHIGRYNAMAIAFAVQGGGIIALTYFIDRPVWFVVLTGFTFFSWGEIFSLFPAAIADVFGPKYATTNYGIQYTSKGLASIFAGWGAAFFMQMYGSWTPVFWAAVVCDLLAAALAFFAMKPIVAARLARAREAAPAQAELAGVHARP